MFIKISWITLDVRVWLIDSSLVDNKMEMSFSFFLFFFQAEDGIRDTSVTGVQTCALPICGQPFPGRRENYLRVIELTTVCNDRPHRKMNASPEIGRASCRERV